MPPNLDIYAITEDRSIDIINDFLEKYIDRQECELRGDEELMLLPMDSTDVPDEV